MKDNAGISWIIILTIFVALGISGIAFYMYIDSIIQGFFRS